MDGTTATTLAPSEDEMSAAMGYIQRMKDAIVEGSKLAQEFAALRGSVEALRNELESLRSTNRWMDGQITELRKQRDDAHYQLTIANDELNKTVNDRNSLQVHCDNQRETLARLNEQVAVLRKERDEALFEGLKVGEEKVQLQERLDAVIGLVCPKPAEPVKEVEQPRDPVTQQFKSYDEDSRPSYEQEPSSKW